MRAAAVSALRRVATATTSQRASALELQPRSANALSQWQHSVPAPKIWRSTALMRWRAYSSKSGGSGIERTEDGARKVLDSGSNAASSTAETRLPSELVSSRHALSARMSRTTDTLLAGLANTSQRVNEYTGTDYTGIASLRSDIRELESAVKVLLSKVSDAKAAHDAAVGVQGASQKEVVQLLERKHSWADGDLERYMALIRSEHEHDAAVKSARDVLRALEHQLEDTRGQLERKERKQYHEEQVWSDTIRRNSTWVTFGLMGFNVFLLLANVVIIEPWRRRRLVQELKTEMDDRMVPNSSASAFDAAFLKEIDDAIPASEVATSDVESENVDTILPGGNLLSVDGDPLRSPPQTTGYAALFKLHLSDLFSNRIISVRKLDITTIAVESAAAGAALVGIFMFWFRPG